MERLFFQREWQRISLKPLASASAAPVADRGVYATFYRQWTADGQALAPEWVAVKRRIGEWIADACVAPRGANGSTWVLSVGAGLGFVERVLVERGYQVDALECEAESLKYLATHVAGVRGMIGDARQIPCRDGLYDVAYLSTVDYCFDRLEYVQVLRELRRVMRPEGRVVVICASNLCLQEIARLAARRVLARRLARDREQVPWGYMRTIGAHLRAGRTAGLACEEVSLFDQAFRLLGTRPGASWRAGWPTFNDAVVAVIFRRAA